jgi:hypothetical protein
MLNGLFSQPPISYDLKGSEYRSLYYFKLFITAGSNQTIIKNNQKIIVDNHMIVCYYPFVIW